MSIINGIIIGLIQGLGEFLPISASGHLSIVQNLFGMSIADESHALFNVLLHLAVLIALCLVCREELSGMFNDCITTFTISDRKIREKARLGTRQVLMLVISTVSLVAMLPFYNAIAKLQSYSIYTGTMLILLGLVLYASDKFLPGKKDGKTITVFDALIIGVCQCVGMLPGMSRVAVAMVAAMCCGVQREYAVKYALLLGLPSLLGGTALSFVNLFSNGVSWAYAPAYLIGTAVALVTGVLAIGGIQLVGKLGTQGKFSYYCWGAGFITIILTAIL